MPKTTAQNNQNAFFVGIRSLRRSGNNRHPQCAVVDTGGLSWKIRDNKNAEPNTTRKAAETAIPAIPRSRSFRRFFVFSILIFTYSKSAGSRVDLLNSSREPNRSQA